MTCAEITLRYNQSQSGINSHFSTYPLHLLFLLYTIHSLSRAFWSLSDHLLIEFPSHHQLQTLLYLQNNNFSTFRLKQLLCIKQKISSRRFQSLSDRLLILSGSRDTLFQRKFHSFFLFTNYITYCNQSQNLAFSIDRAHSDDYKSLQVFYYLFIHQNISTVVDFVACPHVSSRRRKNKIKSICKKSVKCP